MTIPTPVRPIVSKPQAAPAARSSGRMKLANIKRGRVESPPRVLLYAVEKFGKSTFASQAPDPVFIGPEDGTALLDVARYPEPESVHDVFEALDDLATSEHAFRSVVLDTVDWVEPMVLARACEIGDDKGPKDSIEKFGYGKGYNVALDVWRAILARLDRLRTSRGMTVILLAHAHVKAFNDPESESYDRYELKMNAKAAGLLKEWADAVLFGKLEQYAKRVGDDPRKQRVIATDTGTRLLYTNRTAAWDAGNRYSLPPTLPLAWSDFDAAMRAQAVASADDLRAGIAATAADLDEADAANATDAIGRAGDDTTKLAQLLNWARGRVAMKGRKETNR